MKVKAVKIYMLEFGFELGRNPYYQDLAKCDGVP
jgi:hypothetical protein